VKVAAFACKIDETEQGQSETDIGARSLILCSYDIPKYFYGLTGSSAGGGRLKRSAAFHLGELGCMVWYGDGYSHTGRKKRKPVDIDDMVRKWHAVVVGLATAHDKDEADRYEAGVEECLLPLLSAPIKQVREFGPKLLASLQADRTVPYLVWRAYEIWIDQLKDAPDENVKELKTDLSRQIVAMVEEDVKAQLPDAMVRALMWRSPAKLAEVKTVIEAEKAAGRGVRLKGRESCLFLEAGGTEEEPAVCVQV
jgi:hypothetical protein